VAKRTATIATILAMAAVAGACGDDAGVRVRSAAPIADDASAAGQLVPTTSTVPDGVPDTVTPSTTPTVPPTATTAPPTVPPTTEADLTEPEIIEPVLAVEIPFADVVDADADKPLRAHDGFVAVAFTDIERWWAEVFPEVYGAAFEPLDGGIYAGYPERDTVVPGCGEPETPYEELQLYVAFYCNVGDFMAYDDGDDPDFSLLTPLADAYGSAVMGVVLAHEYGHAIQERIGALDQPIATILTEQQADCFAGAWTGQAYRGESPLLRLGDTDVRAGLLAMLEVRDPVGTSQFTPGGHGSAFDRVGAFQQGFIDGPARCAELLDDPLPLMPNQFRFQDDFEREGNAPYDCAGDPDPACRPAPEFLAEDLLAFWRVTFGDDLGREFAPFTITATDALESVTCDGVVALTPQVVVCPAERTVVYDEPEVVELYDEFGDFVLGYIYGVAAAELVQLDLGTGLTGEARALLNDCYTGVWVRDITPDDQGITPRSQRDDDNDGEPDSTVATSPGDLDEAIRMAILLGDVGANVDDVGTAFEKIDAFRTGVLGGLDACRA
jgi:predicted metalloprotease